MQGTPAAPQRGGHTIDVGGIDQIVIIYHRLARQAIEIGSREARVPVGPKGRRAETIDCNDYQGVWDHARSIRRLWSTRYRANCRHSSHTSRGKTIASRR